MVTSCASQSPAGHSVCILLRAWLTIVPVVLWERPLLPGGINCQIFTTLFDVWTFSVGLNVTTTTKKVFHFWEKKSARPEKILATRMRKGARLTLVCPAPEWLIQPWSCWPAWQLSHGTTEPIGVARIFAAAVSTRSGLVRAGTWKEEHCLYEPLSLSLPFSPFVVWYCGDLFCHHPLHPVSYTKCTNFLPKLSSSPRSLVPCTPLPTTPTSTYVVHILLRSTRSPMTLTCPLQTPAIWHH